MTACFFVGPVRLTLAKGKPNDNAKEQAIAQRAIRFRGSRPQAPRNRNRLHVGYDHVSFGMDGYRWQGYDVQRMGSREVRYRQGYPIR